MRSSEDNKIVNIDGSKYKGKGRNKYAKGFLASITPEHIGAAVFLLVFIYLCVNLYIYATKDQVAIYEVQGEDLSYATEFNGICIRDEKLIASDYSGYVNYYIQDGRKSAKSSIVYSIDSSGRNVYSELNDTLNDYKFSDDEIREIKSDLNHQIRNYDGSDLTWISSFKEDITDTIYTYVSSNALQQMNYIYEGSTSGSDFHTVRTPASGIISYKCDSLTGLTVNDISENTFGKDMTSFKEINLVSNGLIAKEDSVYRICTNEEWSVVVDITEDFYKSNLENRTASIYIDGSADMLTGTMNCFQKGGKYFAQITFDNCMSSYINKRYVTVEFSSETEQGLKIPVSAIVKKDYYVVPINMFVAQESSTGKILYRENYDQTTGEINYESIYLSKYWSDGYYAYIDQTVLNEGDYLYNPETDERYKVAAINNLYGVYCVNKGYYVFTVIERLRYNEEYFIVKKSTEGGLKLYDHIALNAQDAVEGKIIY